MGCSAFGSSNGQGPECYKRGALRERGIRVKYALDKFDGPVFLIRSLIKEAVMVDGCGGHTVE